MRDFAISNQLFLESYSSAVGNQAELLIGSGSTINDFNGTVCGLGNTIQIESDVTIAGLRLEIDGNNNSIVLGKGANFKNCRIYIHADKEAGNFRGNRNNLCIGAAGSFVSTLIDCKGSDNSLLIGSKVYVLMNPDFFL